MVSMAVGAGQAPTASPQPGSRPAAETRSCCGGLQRPRREGLREGSAADRRGKVKAQLRGCPLVPSRGAPSLNYAVGSLSAVRDEGEKTLPTRKAPGGAYETHGGNLFNARLGCTASLPQSFSLRGRAGGRHVPLVPRPMPGPYLPAAPPCPPASAPAPPRRGWHPAGPCR